MILAHEVTIGMKIIVPTLGRTKHGITIRRIEPGRFKSSLRFYYNNTAFDISRFEPVQVVNHDSSS